jgi:hypothetical protein
MEPREFLVAQVGSVMKREDEALLKRLERGLRPSRHSFSLLAGSSISTSVRSSASIPTLGSIHAPATRLWHHQVFSVPKSRMRSAPSSVAL